MVIGSHLSESSASKLIKRGQENLLAGCAIVKHLFPLVAAEYGEAVSIDQALAFGTLPSIMADPSTAREQLEAYVGNLFARRNQSQSAYTKCANFWALSGSCFFNEMNGQVTNLANVARGAVVACTTVSVYFDILVDTLFRTLAACLDSTCQSERQGTS